MDALNYVVVVDGEVVGNGSYAEACEQAKALAQGGTIARIKSERQHALDTDLALKVDLSGLTSNVKVELPVSKGAQAAAAVLSQFNSKPQLRRQLIVDAIKVVLDSDRSVFFKSSEEGVITAKLNIVGAALEWAVGAGLISLDWLSFDGNDQAGLTPGRQRMLVQWIAYFQAVGKLPRSNEDLAL
jgi:hypothetical protein